MQGFIVRVYPSRKLQLLAVVLYLLTLPVIMLFFSGWERIGWLAGLFGCGCWSFYHLRQPVVKRITINAELQAQLTLAKYSKRVSAVLLADSMVRRGFLALKWQTSDGEVRIVLLPDMTDKQSWRRLQVWARWCQPQHTRSSFWRNVVGKSRQINQQRDKQTSNE